MFPLFVCVRNCLLSNVLILQIPRDHYWLKFDEWIRDYGQGDAFFVFFAFSLMVE